MADSRSEKSENSNKSYSDDESYSRSASGSEDDYESGPDDRRDLIEESKREKPSTAVSFKNNGLIQPSNKSKAEKAGNEIPLLPVGEPIPSVVVVQPTATVNGSKEGKRMHGPFDSVKSRFWPKKPQSLSIVSFWLKYSLTIFCMFFWFVGGLFASIGGWQVSQLSDYEGLSDFATDPPLIFTALGCLIFIVSSFGVLGAYRENICCLRVYKIFLIIIIVFEFCAGLAGFAFWAETKKIIQVTIKRGIIDYYNSNPVMHDLIDSIQQDLQCCGSESYDDWDSNWYFKCQHVASYKSCGVPWSCCIMSKEDELRTNVNRMCGYRVRQRKRSQLEGVIYTDGCLEAAFGYFKDNLLLIALLGVIFTLPLFVGIYMSMRLVKQIKKQIWAVDPALYQKMRNEQTGKCCLTNVLAEPDDYV